MRVLSRLTPGPGMCYNSTNQLTTQFDGGMGMKASAATATKLIDALQARVRFGEVMEEVEKRNTRFLVSRRGKPKLVMLSIEDYLKNILREQGLLAEIQLTAEEKGLIRITSEEIDSEIRAYRRDKKKRKG